MVGRTRAPIDLAVAAGLAGVAMLLAWIDAPLALQLPFGLLLVLLLPGYAITAITHPGEGVDGPDRKAVRSLAMPDRLAVSAILSLVASVLTGLALSFTPAGLTIRSTSGAIAGVTVLACALALAVRLVDTPEERRPEFRWTRRRPSWHEWASLVALAAALAFLGIAAAGFVGDARDDGYVSLFVEPNFVVDCYPLEYRNGTYGPNPAGGPRCAGAEDLLLVVNNHETHAIDYTLRLEWSRVAGAELPGTVFVRESQGRLEPLPPEDPLTPRAELARQHSEPLAAGPPPYEGLQYLKVHLFLGDADGTPDQALQLRVVRA